MTRIADRPADSAIHGQDAVIAASLELSHSRWLVTVLSPNSDRMSKYTLEGGDAAGLIALLGRLKLKLGADASHVRIILIQEAGLDGFWVHRCLVARGIESHVVDPASIAVPRRNRRAKTDAIDGETLLRALLAWLRGEPRVCSMVRVPTPEEEDRRRLVRERAHLLKERVRLTNYIAGLLFSQGTTDYQPLRRDRRQRLQRLITGDGRPLPPHLKAELLRCLDRLEPILRQLTEIEGERDHLVAEAAPQLLSLRSIGPDTAAVLAFEAFHRHFDNRRQIAAYAGLAASPWRSGDIQREQGISKAGNPQLRKTMTELAWLWLRYQPASTLARWFRDRVGAQRGRIRRIAIIALARKLLVALWRFVTQGVTPDGAVFKTA